MPELLATYRVQLSAAFDFRDALAIVPYLHALGVSHLYASPVLKARPGSTHGYDTTDPGALNPELGTEADFAALTDALRERGMGLLLDIVPNHAAAHAGNPRWWDVLRHGRRSAHADHFDIDFGPDPAAPAKIVLPVLGAPMEEVAAKGELKVVIHDGLPALAYHKHRFPLGPTTLGPGVVAVASRLARLGQTTAATAWGHAVESGDASGADDAFTALLASSPEVRLSIDAALAGLPTATVRGIAEAQSYRLTFWKDGLASINYRRFFDVSDLVAVRAERPEVFDAVHALPLHWAAEGRVQALRIDHIDGLYDPHAYLHRLAERLPGDQHVAVLVEKILAPDEALPDDWPVDGSTGYDALNRLNALFVEPAGAQAIAAHARRLLGLPTSFSQTAGDCKRLAIARLFPAEFAALGARLTGVAREAGMDVPDRDLRGALEEITAGLHVYRTYIADGPLSEHDRRRLEEAVDHARERAAVPATAIDAVARVLMGDVPEAARPAALAFTRRWQQFTGPVMAKGVEDTALYRHVVLASLNEVGAEADVPADAANPVRLYHEANAATLERHPRSLAATSTHDTKRSEDARARLNALPSLAAEWTAAVDRWLLLNAPCRTNLPTGPAPSTRDEVLFYQSLLAVWPLDAADAGSLVERLRAYAVKASREAKVETSWSDPSAEYEAALGAFIERALHAEDGRFLAEVAAFAARLAPAGAVNGLAQVVLKAAAPGVPDFYQGTELWHLALVDPDNRRPVDFARRQDLLAALPPASPEAAAELLRDWPGGRVKLHVTRPALAERARDPDLFLRGEYLPLTPAGEQADNLVAFARRLEGRWAIAIAPSWPLPALREGEAAIDADRWATVGPAHLRLPDGAPASWRHALTGAAFTTQDGRLDLATLLAAFPVALLVSA
jgi:(1->4)-alpha-D-glucan 1-alpha-D-glucosylmutase